MKRLAQSETYLPSLQEPDTGVTAVAFGIRRFSDGYWYDFDDSSFKNTGCVEKHKAMSEDDNGLWIYDTGWAVPDSNDSYVVQAKITDAAGSFYEKIDDIVVNSTYSFSIADIIAGIADGSYDLQEMLRLIFAACCCKSSGGGTSSLAFRDSADGKDRISATVDANGNRTSITLDGS